MKKLILLISICLLSQNYTIANANGDGETHYSNAAPVPLENQDSANILRIQNSYSGKFIQKSEEAKDDTATVKSSLKLPKQNQTEVPESITQKNSDISTPQQENITEEIIPDKKTSIEEDKLKSEPTNNNRDLSSKEQQSETQTEKESAVEINTETEALTETIEEEEKESKAEEPEQKEDYSGQSILKQFAPKPFETPKEELTPTKFVPATVTKAIEEQEKAAAEAKAKAEAEAKAKAEAEAKAKAEAEAKAKADAEAKAKAEAEAKAKAEAEAKAKAEAEAKAKAEAEAKAKAEEEAKAKAEAEAKAKAEAEAKAKTEAEAEIKATLKEKAEKALTAPQEKSVVLKKESKEENKKKTEINTPSQDIEITKDEHQSTKIEEQSTDKPVDTEPELTEEEARHLILKQHAPKPIVNESAQSIIIPKFVPKRINKILSAMDNKKEQSKEQVTNNENKTLKATVQQPITIVIKRVDFPESKVFSPKELQTMAAPYISHPVTIEEIKKLVEDITRCYTIANYPTSKAYIPPQEIEDGVLKIALMEGKIGKVNVEGNKWTRSSYFKKRIANREGELLNIEDLEKDVIRFNNNNASKVSVSLSPGENRGESDITINAIEPFPFRIAFMTDNQGRKSIGTGRTGAMIASDSLFKYSDKMAVGGYLGRGNRIGFADYSIPVGIYGTRLGISAAASNISVVNGPLRHFDVGGTSQVYSAYITHPIFDSESANISTYTAANFRKSTSDIFDYVYYSKNTLSLTQGFTAKKDTTKGIWYTGHYGSVGFKTGHDDNDFFKYEGNITRLHDFGKGIIGQFRASGQYSPNNDLPWMEQFQVGGMSTVRGYSEALLLGKSGYFASAEIITPLPILPKRIGSDRLGYIYPREMIKGAVFMDNGMIFPYKGGDSIDSGDFLMSWGFGLRINLKDDLTARFYWGYGLHNIYETDYKMGRFHFDITCSPDISKVVSQRKPSQKKSDKEKNNLQENI